MAHSLYPEKRKTKDGKIISDTDAVVSRKEVAISVGLMNIVFCPFGSIPNCHGAGGLAGQYSLGARGGSSVVFLGLMKVLLATFFGASALTLLDALPIAVLGVMLSIAGLELASTGLSLLIKQSHPEDLRRDTMVSLVTAAVILSLKKTHYGAIAGWFTFIIYGDGTQQFSNWIQRVRSSNSQETTESVEGNDFEVIQERAYSIDQKCDKSSI